MDQQNQSIEILQSIRKQKHILKQTLLTHQNSNYSQTYQFHQIHSDSRSIEGLISNFKEATNAEFPKCGIRSDIKFYQFILTSQNQQYHILIHHKLWPQVQQNCFQNIIVRLYLPQSKSNQFYLFTGNKKFLLFKPKQTKKDQKTQIKNDQKLSKQSKQKDQQKLKNQEQYQEQKKAKKPQESKGKFKSKSLIKNKRGRKKGKKNEIQGEEDQNQRNNEDKDQNQKNDKQKEEQKQQNAYNERKQFEFQFLEKENEEKQEYQQLEIQNEENPQLFTILSQPYLILQPWINVDSKTVYPWSDCQRFRVLSQYVKSEYTELQSISFQKVCHNYFKHMLSHLDKFKNLNFTDSKGEIQTIYQNNLFQMYLLTKINGFHVNFQYFFTQCQQILSQIHFFVRDHLINKKSFQVGQRQFILIQQKFRTQTLYSTQFFGLSGKTDAFFKAQMKLDKFNKKSSWVPVNIAFQLKSGFYKAKYNHRTDIANMLIQQQLINQSKTINLVGLSLYIGKNGLKKYRDVGKYIDYQQCISQRNKFVLQQKKLFQSNQINLPPLYNKKDIKKNDKIHCEGCYAAQKCQIIHKMDKQNTQQSFQITDIEEIIPSDYNDDTKIKQKIQRISSEEYKYAQKWFRWLHIEQKESLAEKQEQRKKSYHIKPNHFIITKQQLKRIQLGCKRQKNNQNNPKQLQTEENSNKIRFVIEKQVQVQSHLQTLGKIFIDEKEVNITILSIGIKNKACRVFSVTKIMPNVFLVEIQIYTKLQVNSGHLQQALKKGLPIKVQLYNFSIQTQNTQRLNIMNLLLSDNNEQLKKLTIDDYKPKIPQNLLENKNKTHGITLKMERMQPQNQNKKKLNPMNSKQNEALEQIMSDQFCTLVKGMPGTGKTDLIVQVLARYKEMKNKTVLIASFTNRALDNIVLRALELQVISQKEAMREGNQQKIDQNLLGINSRNLKFKKIDQYEAYFKQKRFWFTTLSSVSNNQLLPKKFDLVILDEASQCLQPLCIGALIRGQKIVMIGDHQQLSPLVKAKIPFSQGMAMSLFQRLCQKQKSVSLTQQYRMNNKILNFCNTLVYNGGLATGCKSVQTRKIAFKNNQWEEQCESHDLVTILDPNNEVLIVNHETISNLSPSNEIKEELSHIMEVEIACVLLFKFIQLGINPKQITIICLYNKTVETIKRLIKRMHSNMSNSQNQNIPKLSTTQVLTVDKCQGIDKQVIIFVAEMKYSLNNSLIESQKRVNVSVTRAKMKMIFIGSLAQLRKLKVFKNKFVQLLEQTNQLKITENFIQQIINQFSALLNPQQNPMKQQ